jgi:hypothetical protein
MAPTGSRQPQLAEQNMRVNQPAKVASPDGFLMRSSWHPTMTYWDFNGHSTGYVNGLKQEIMGN